MALMGAELLFFPTAIGTEPPPALPLNSREHWQRTQQGHAAANLTPLIASNRYGLERSLQNPEGLYINFYGSSFIADPTGAKVAGKSWGLMKALEKLQMANQQMPMADATPATAHLFIVNPLSGATLARLFSTHPPLEERIARLRAMRV